MGTDKFGSQPLDPTTLAYNKPDFIDPVPVPNTNYDSMWGISNNLFAFNNQLNSTWCDILFWRLIAVDSNEFDSGQTINVWSLDGINNTNSPNFLLAQAVDSRNVSIFSTILALLNTIF